MSFNKFSANLTRPSTRHFAPLTCPSTPVVSSHVTPHRAPFSSALNHINVSTPTGLAATPQACLAQWGTSTPQSTSSHGTKRKDQPDSAATPGSKRLKRDHLEIEARLTLPEKRQKIIQLLSMLRLTLGEALSLLLSYSPDTKSPYHISDIGEAHVIQAYLSGRNKAGETLHSPGAHLKLMLDHPYGQPHRVEAREQEMMYATEDDCPYYKIRHVRAAFTAFAVQITSRKLRTEIRDAVLPGNGLHISRRVPGTRTTRGAQVVEWTDIGANSWARTNQSIQRHQPVTYKLLTGLLRKKKKKDAQRPIESVITSVISTLDFTFNQRANLLPSALGLLYLAYSAPVDLFAVGSRLGLMPAYSTILSTAKGLAWTEKKKIYNNARATDGTPWLQIDNSQSYVRRRHERFGSDNQMIVGISGIFVEGEDEPPGAADLEAKRRVLAEGKRSQLTVRDFSDLLDLPHLNGIFAGHWLKVLVNYIPELRTPEYHKYLINLFRVRFAKIKKADKPSKIHPLSSCSKNENITGELKDGLLDFLAQMGQVEDDFTRGRYIRLGGDGLTFERTNQLLRYMQFDQHDLRNLSLLDPVLAPWHTLWTFQSSLFTAHYDSNLSSDPSTLGHSANAINRKPPPSLAKVDYYAGKELVDTVIDARILDIWRNHFDCSDIFEYFKLKSSAGMLPTIEELEKIAVELHVRFSSTQAYYQAVRDANSATAWSSQVPLGTPWPVPPVPGAPQPASACKKAEPTFPTDYQGDFVLAASIILLRDGILTRECAYAMAEGDVGRMYEVMKMFLFIFAGSSNSKYVTYLLETICSLEWESTPEQQKATLRGMVANILGLEGHHAGIDILLEHFNRLLEAIISKKGQEFGASFIRNIISPNVHHFSRIKIDLRETIGLARRHGRHAHPDATPEIRKLLDVYQEHELHRRRPGRQYSWRNIERFEDGYSSLAGRGGRVAKWVNDTVRTRGLVDELKMDSSVMGEESSEEDDDGPKDPDPRNDAEDEDDVPDPHTSGLKIRLMLPARVLDGLLVAQDVNEDALEWSDDGLGEEVDGEDTSSGGEE